MASDHQTDTTTIRAMEDQWRTFFGTARIVLDATSAAEQTLRLRAGTGFNVFDWIDPTENDLSDIIRDLLDPQGSHGQEDAFLGLAAKGLFPFPPDFDQTNLKKCVVVREARTHEGRRLDLILDLGRTAIGIENKPFIGESEAQITDYVYYLQRRFSGNFYMVFLHGAGAESKSLKPALRETLIKSGRFREIPYFSRSAPCFHKWLIDCATVCQADKVRLFILDFADYVADRFGPSEGSAR